ncbi:UDP-N-acetylmuramate dehydrogenase [Sharpea azabuensis]|uniref:UDP-N-acetylmuramate dehydrogenase n=1 Tax=Sharpea azabuensis TaxID=322505 RepID=UPI0013D92787|nr:UDP-N-acetylmuramate dehydrogenase [Sharpea azabuensis]
MDEMLVKEFLRDNDVGKVVENEPMYKHTTYKVGGPARFFIEVKDMEALKRLLEFVRKNHIRHMVIGRGSDLLFSDREYEGIIISLNGFNQYQVNGNIIKAQAGVSMIALSYQAAKLGLSGFEFMGGIPGAMGGGLYMNAGAYKYCIADVFKEATILNENNELMILNKEEMAFGYRQSILQKHKEWILLDATFEMTIKDPAAIKSVLDKRKERRMTSQPWNFACAGSVFRNPEGKSAWQYIDEAGLRGFEIGGAQVSPKHSNFIVNNGYASAKDILDLIHLVQAKVEDQFGVKLHKEVILVNWE